MLSEASTSFGTASPEPSGQQFVGTMPIESKFPLFLVRQNSDNFMNFMHLHYIAFAIYFPATPKTARIRVWKMRTPSTKRKLQHYRSIIMRLGRVIVSMKRPVKRTVSHTRLIAEAGKHLSKDLLELLNVQVHLQPLRKHWRCWPMPIRKFALNLYFSSPKAYKSLYKFLSLPTVIMLKTRLSAVTIKPDLLPAILDLIKTKNWQFIERACCLVFDEISLKRNLQYDPQTDLYSCVRW